METFFVKYANYRFTYLFEWNAYMLLLIKVISNWTTSLLKFMSRTVVENVILKYFSFQDFDFCHVTYISYITLHSQRGCGLLRSVDGYKTSSEIEHTLVFRLMNWVSDSYIMLNIWIINKGQTNCASEPHYNINDISPVQQTVQVNTRMHLTNYISCIYIFIAKLECIQYVIHFTETISDISILSRFPPEES